MRYLKLLPIILFVASVLYFFKPFIFENKLPIPADTIIGLYHPFRDLYSEDYPNGIPFKNFLITDPVRQQYVWRELAISLEKKLELPLWNPYSFSGTPLLANMQSAIFYPFNILFFLLPFEIAWSILIMLQPLLAGIFLYLYLNNLKTNKWASLLGAIAFSFSGFSVAWMEWGTVLHVGLWLPLALLAIDKIFAYFQFVEKSNIKYQKSKIHIKNKKLITWGIIFVFSLSSALFAGHIQTFFYLFVFATTYFFSRWFQYGKIFNILFVFLIFNILFLILTSIQWIPTLQFILESAREIDQVDWQKEGWFIPWQHLIQFIAPDFFGNPTTLNYWGVWNYGEFIGYIGILPLTMAIFALFFRHDKKTLFYGAIFFVSLILSFPTILAKLPYVLNIPFLSTSQPTRLLFVTDFSLAILAAFGFDYFVRSKSKKILYPLGFIIFVFLSLWAFVVFGNGTTNVLAENLLVAKRNLIFPTLVFLASSILLFSIARLSKLSKKHMTIIYIVIAALTTSDIVRFGLKFTPFTNKEYLFPSTSAISFLKKQEDQFRIMATDSRILPPNFSVIYRLQSVDGYDPLYLRRYGELIAASERGLPNIIPPFGFNRIITPQDFESKIINLLGVKYILSLSDLESPKLKKVFQEGKTRIYENKKALPRVFFVGNIEIVKDKNSAIEKMFRANFDPAKTAVVENSAGVVTNPPQGCTKCKAKVVFYQENKITIETENVEEGFLVLTDSFYPTWKAKIDGVETTVNRVNYNFRGTSVPKGNHKVEFYTRLF